MVLNTVIALLSPLAVALVLWLAWRAAKTARTAQGAVGWVVFLLSAPYVAVLAYAFVGPHRYASQRRARQKSRQLFDSHRSDWPEASHNDPMAVSLRPFEQVAGFPVVRGNDVRILVDGAATFAAIFDAVDRAEDYLLVMFYIYRDDALGRDLADRLIAATDRGVTVRLAVDVFGSAGFGRRLMGRLRAAGVEVVRARGGPITRKLQVNFRNHRKVVIADGKVALMGGLNVGDEYLGRSRAFGPWRDTFCRIEGPMVTQLQILFAEDWHWTSGEALPQTLDWTSDADAGSMEGLIVGTGPIETEDTGSAMIFATLAAARRRIWISTPYLVPNLPTLSVLKNAAMRGLDVRILVPDRIDHYLPWLAAFAYFDELLEAGVQVWRYTDGFLHQKAFLIDDGIGAIGTHNLDYRSASLNFETMAYVFDEGFCKELEQVLKADFARATRLRRTLDEQPIYLRIAAPVARLMAPVL